jgi:hypothetical protein
MQLLFNRLNNCFHSLNSKFFILMNKRVICTELNKFKQKYQNGFGEDSF